MVISAMSNHHDVSRSINEEVRGLDQQTFLGSKKNMELCGSSSLSDTLTEAFQTNFESKHFCPITELSRWITQENVVPLLKSINVCTRDIDKMATPIVEESPKTFAILVIMQKVCLIEPLYWRGFSDQDIPISSTKDVDGRAHWRSQLNDLQGVFDSTTWYNFEQSQWTFFAPVFEEAKYEYKFEPQQPLPFLSKRDVANGSFSVVSEVTIHSDHISKKYGNHAKFAVKTVLQNPVMDRYDEEREVLKVIRQLDHPHLISVIAAYEQNSNRCFLFPWAEKGNVRNFWRSNDALRHDSKFVPWMVEQLYGLFDGLYRLHYFRQNENWRHGDLKPENILVFTREGKDILVVADLGLTTFHEHATPIRLEQNIPTYTLTGTKKYGPPEVDEQHEKRNPRSRLYDMWSMGCITLEFLIWLLYGFEELGRFNATFDRFWEKIEGVARPHREVKKWISHIEKDPRCQYETVVHDLVLLVREKLLVVPIPMYEERNVGQGSQPHSMVRNTSETVRNYLAQMKDRLRDLSYVCSPSWDECKRLPGPAGTAIQSSDGRLAVEVKSSSQTSTSLVHTAGLNGDEAGTSELPIRIERQSTPESADEPSSTPVSIVVED